MNTSDFHRNVDRSEHLNQDTPTGEGISRRYVPRSDMQFVMMDDMLNDRRQVDLATDVDIVLTYCIR